MSATGAHIVTGREGEAIALHFLSDKGWTIVESNWSWRGGELDIVAMDDDCLVFVEVKRRKSVRHGRASYAVGAQKQKQIVRSAMAYLKATGRSISDTRMRFDVIAIDGAIAPFRLQWFPSAFHAQEYS